MKIMTEKAYYDKVYGGWMGKNIGGTLGIPFEGSKEKQDLKFYSEAFNEPIENDDLDMQLVWLHALEQYGPGLTSRELSKEWLSHVFFCFDEYGRCLTNMRRGLVPPVSGSFDNPFIDCMGSPIRSEIWAMITPGCPELAAYYAHQDAIVDHAGGEGVYGEVFFAVMESAAFFEGDINKLLDMGMASIPSECRTYRAVDDMRRWHAQGRDWIEARNLAIEHHGMDNFTDAPQNIAFIILGLLYGKDFGDSICKAVNCGCDTDCTGATLGALLGIIGGRDSLPSNWIEPIGDSIKVSKTVNGINAPVNLDELTRRTMSACRKTLLYWGVPTSISKDEGFLPGKELSIERISGIHDMSLLNVTEIDTRVNRYILPIGSSDAHDMEVEISYGQDGPSIGRNQTKGLAIKVKNLLNVEYSGTIELMAPQDWEKQEACSFKLKRGESFEWKTAVVSNGNVKPWYDLKLCISRHYNQMVWATETVPFSLVASEYWYVMGPGDTEEKLLVCPGTAVEFERAINTSMEGEYYAKSLIHNPSERQVSFVAATSSRVRLKLDGKTLFSDNGITEYMPAYHRGTETKRAEVMLAPGKHTLEVFLTKGKEKLQLSVLPVEGMMYNNRSFYTDITFEGCIL